MTLSELKTVLEGATGFSGKVVYHAWPESQAPALPFICYQETNSTNFFADDMVYQPVMGVRVELYSKRKDTASESAVETALNAAGISWEKTEEWLTDERCCEIYYEFQI